MSRMLAAKASLAVRYDALAETAVAQGETGAAKVTNAEMGMEHRVKLEARLRQLEEQQVLA